MVNLQSLDYSEINRRIEELENIYRKIPENNRYRFRYEKGKVDAFEEVKAVLRKEEKENNEVE